MENDIKMLIEENDRLRGVLETIRKELPNLTETHIPLIDKLIDTALSQRHPRTRLMELKDIEMSSRLRNCLNNIGLKTIGEASEKRECEFLRYRNFGLKSLRELKVILQRLGLSFKK